MIGSVEKCFPQKSGRWTRKQIGYEIKVCAEMTTVRNLWMNKLLEMMC